ncbi:Imm71 family immunity protein [Cupriavidus taiwanensis]|uniref:Imm71 family immunity protein n=1 Tax=Cupriavidus taiwanensis TaxID=164546 RepID=UPI0025425818|nr:Imm71 family immunity protein [Cupriavidus taiwanensis]MDK3022118.1 Imm71 family immunity protein [Cupriavidus taiwanensis]
MSSYNNLNASVMLPSDHERRQIFYWLKQASSYTAWNRIYSFYRAWCNAAANCRRLASKVGVENSTRVSESHYLRILHGFAHCEEAILRLKRGDRRVFKYDANGEFAMANQPLSHWVNYLMRIDWGEHPPIDEGNTPGWTVFHNTLTELTDAWGECAPDVLESPNLDDAAYTVYGVWLQQNLPTRHFPRFLPEIPDPNEPISVATGKPVPHSGIWEPVEARKPQLLSLFRRSETVNGPLAITGCMNYLHGDSIAPKATLETKDDNPEVNTIWRLLWRDNRYEDGTVPNEEKNYIFLRPDTPTWLDPKKAIDISDPLIWAETGQPAPKSGKWLAEHDLRISITMEVGAPLPMHEGRPTRWLFAKA